METHIEFITDKNKKHYLKMVFDWLQSDYIRMGEPDGHFWHNRKIIKKAFNENDALVAINDDRNVVGYLVYDPGVIRAEIDIVQVKKEYQGRGIMKKMFSKFCDRYPEVSVLTGTVIPQSKEIFRKIGFVSTIIDGQEKFYKVLKTSTLTPSK